MKTTLILLVPLFLLATSPFESPRAQNFDLSAFNTKAKKVDKDKGTRIVCKFVCNKKLSKTQTITDAISFYKKKR